MNVVERNNLVTEAKMQINALHKISGWKKLAMIVSAIGVAMAYAGISATPSNLFLGISGIFLILAGAAAAVVMNLGLRNGKRNVEKMIHIIDGNRVS